MNATVVSDSRQSPLVLRASHLGKEYKLYASPRDRLKALVTGRAYHSSHWALRDVSFELRRGQSLGVIGDNGAGKSSLLKLMAGTVQPSSGAVERMGRVTAILELGAGFHPEFTGRDNLYFSGSLIGISNAEMAKLEHEVITFSELGPAIDRPVKTYSSGMTVRLAFALVTAVQPDLLIIDEALAVGDQHFQKKCVERIEEFRNNGCTILFCSHSLYHVRHLCDTTIWLDKGLVRDYGDTETVLASYGVHVREQDTSGATKTSSDTVECRGTWHDMEPGTDSKTQERTQPAAMPEKRAELVSVEVADLGTGTPPLLESNDLVVTVTSRMFDDEQPSMAVMLEQSHGVGITAVATHVDGATPHRLADGLWRTTVTFDNLPLHSSDYVVSAYLFDSRGLVVYDEWMKYIEFRWVAPSRLPGLVHLPHHWS
jgi:lipopolysaccharide transport system ATP-binding protein